MTNKKEINVLFFDQAKEHFFLLSRVNRTLLGAHKNMVSYKGKRYKVFYLPDTYGSCHGLCISLFTTE